MKGRILFHEPMGPHTTFRIGGPAERFAVPLDREDFQNLLGEMPEGETITVVGAGSNLLVSDQGVRGTVVHTAGLDWICMEGRNVTVGAGVMLPSLLRNLLGKGLGGMEWLAGIPGTVGGAVKMNAGTGEGSMADRLVSVDLLHRSGRQETRTKTELTYGYRWMKLPAETWIVGAELSLETRKPEQIRQEIERNLKARRKSQPLGLPCAGSIFKNPPGDFAGRLIDEAGMKGAKEGDAEVSPVHANFIVNRGRARATDVLILIQKIRDRVKEKFDIVLELEIKLIGEWERDEQNSAM